jgi:hypothetical protein
LNHESSDLLHESWVGYYKPAKAGFVCIAPDFSLSDRGKLRTSP